MSTEESWMPEIGTMVYLNRPDGGPLGEVVGYVTDEIAARRGQPIIERDGKRSVIHPMFLLPMRHGSPAHRKAMGRA